MTIKQLTDKLSEYPDDLPVYFFSDENCGQLYVSNPEGRDCIKDCIIKSQRCICIGNPYQLFDAEWHKVTYEC